MTLTNLCDYANNYFEKAYESGDFVISSNSIHVANEYKEGQYVRVMDSLLNDGVYKVHSFAGGVIVLEGTLIDESFNGYIVSMCIPKEFVDLVAPMNAYDNQVNKGVSSESIPNYSVSYDSNSNSYKHFAAQIDRYHKFYQGRYYFIKILNQD